jgi:hypothetical protein
MKEMQRKKEKTDLNISNVLSLIEGCEMKQKMKFILPRFPPALLLQVE